MNEYFTPGKWEAKPVDTYGHQTYEIHYTRDGECVAEVVHNLEDALLMARSKDMYELLQRFIQEGMLSHRGDEEATQLLETIFPKGEPAQ